jgi:hypothetical protein
VSTLSVVGRPLSSPDVIRLFAHRSGKARHNDLMRRLIVLVVQGDPRVTVCGILTSGRTHCYPRRCCDLAGLAEGAARLPAGMHARIIKGGGRA